MVKRLIEKCKQTKWIPIKELNELFSADIDYDLYQNKENKNKFNMIFNRKHLRFFSRFFQDFENFREKSNFFANARIEKNLIYFQLNLMRYK